MRSSVEVSDAIHDSAVLSPRWLPWLRALWVFVALDTLFVFGYMLYLTRQFADNSPLRIATELSASGLTRDSYFWFNAVVSIVSSAGYFVIGSLIFLLRPKDRLAWLASIFLIAYAAVPSAPLAPEYALLFSGASPLFRVLYFVNSLFSWCLLVAFFGVFPNGRFVPNWIRYFAVYGFFFSVAYGIFPDKFGAPEGVFAVWVYGSLLLMFVGSLYAQVWRYRKYSTPLQKQQTKWLMFGLLPLVIVFLPYLLVYSLINTGHLPPATALTLELTLTALVLGQLMVPSAIAIAIVRYRLWDIDIIIRRTLVYSVVTILLALLFNLTEIIVQQLFSGITGQSSEIAIIVSTLAIAALFVPLRRRVQVAIDHRFYRRKYDAQQVLTNFARTARDETDLNKLTDELIRVADETMKPESVSVWFRQEQGKK